MSSLAMPVIPGYALYRCNASALVKVRKMLGRL
jgi:hypothetical protein